MLLFVTIVGIALVAIIVIATLFGDDRNQSVERQLLSLLERKLDAIIHHLGIDVDAIEEELTRQELDKLKATTFASKVEAIKAYRKMTGKSLRESKEFVDRNLKIK